MIILTGNVGSGKSFLASKLAVWGAVVVNMDSIVKMVLGGRYDVYDPNKKDVYRRIEEEAIRAGIESGNEVVVDRTNMDRKTRSRYINIAKSCGSLVTCYDFGSGKGLFDKLIERRAKNQRNVTIRRWEKIISHFSEIYEPPSEDEGIDNILTPPEKYIVYAYDFDGTIVENKYPDIGAIKPGLKSELYELHKEINNIIIIWTCRSGENMLEMRGFLNDNNVKYDYINENPLFETGSRKIFANFYKDDRNI
jgi:predicted kinase